MTSPTGFPASLPPLIWIDLEMSGLDVDSCTILEAAVIVTDGDLNELGEPLDLVVHQPDAVLAAMDEWCTTHHGASGLTAKVRASTTSLTEAEQQILTRLAADCEKGASPLCGNSTGQDRKFIERYMPELAAFLHYRTVDVSSIKELARRWYPRLGQAPKSEAHRALDDIRESIGELRYYRAHIFREEPA